jgi:hypothetical protein
MSSRIDLARLAGAALAFMLPACGVNGDQVLGNILTSDDNPINVDASPPGPDGSGRCSEIHYMNAQEIGANLDVYFLIDRSQSMFDPTGDKWDAFVSGFTHFLRSPAVEGIGIGAGYFPSGGNFDCASCGARDCNCLAGCGCPCDMRMNPRVCAKGPTCDPASYNRPDVDIAPMPQNGSALLLSLAQPVAGHTVIRPALEGALQFATDHAQHDTADRTDVVLVVGGPPSTTDCAPDTISDCADAVASSSTKTSVVAFDYTGPGLDAIATRGGGKLYSFDSHRDDIGMRFTDVISDLKAEPHCVYEFAPNNATDGGRVNVQITFPPDDAGGFRTVNPRLVQDRASCNGGPGWYYDDSSHPTQIIMCDATCREIQGPPEGGVGIAVGCGATPPP